MKKVFFILLLLFVQTAFSFTSQSQLRVLDGLKGDESYNYPDYYQVKEDPRLPNTDLLSFEHIQKNFPTPSVPYNRKTQFGTWITDQSDGSCLNTRGKALVRDSKSNVTYRPNGCSVASGDWDDPYSAKHFASASDIQIDHFVPLKNAYMTGAFEWDQSKRCLYANYLGNNFHLLSVSGQENMNKSDSTPSQYMPPNKNYACIYLKQWLEIKTIWSLRITPKEATALKTKIGENHCDQADFVVTNRFLADQRRFMSDHANLCRLQ